MIKKIVGDGLNTIDDKNDQIKARTENTPQNRQKESVIAGRNKDKQELRQKELTDRKLVDDKIVNVMNENDKIVNVMDENDKIVDVMDGNDKIVNVMDENGNIGNVYDDGNNNFTMESIVNFKID